MKVPGLGLLRLATQRVRHWIAPGGVILLYHRIAEVAVDPFNLCVTPQHFAEHLAVLQERFSPTSLQQVARTLVLGKHPDRAVAVTFDDGYADNLWNAKPLLEHVAVPATVFVTTGHAAQQREFWWDSLDRLLLYPGTLPSCLDLLVDGKAHHWELGEATKYTDAEFERDRRWTWYVQEQADPGPRQRLFRALYQLLRPLTLDQRHALCNELVTWAGVTVQGRASTRSLTAVEIGEIGSGSLIEVGAHTVNHPLLTSLSTESQWHEIRQSKLELEAWTGRPVRSFAYPHGNFDPQTLDLVRRAGFAYACSTAETRVWRHADPFQLPRIVVEDCDGETFARWLSGWFQT